MRPAQIAMLIELSQALLGIAINASIEADIQPDSLRLAGCAEAVINMIEKQKEVWATLKEEAAKAATVRAADAAEQK